MNNLTELKASEAQVSSVLSRITKFDGRSLPTAGEGASFHPMNHGSGGPSRTAPQMVLVEPKFPAAALYGIAGDIVRKLEPYSEAHPAALYLQLLTCFGSALGGGTYFEVESDRHCTNLFLAVVGKSAKARKGVSWGRIHKIMSQVDCEWSELRQASGLSSGEGLVYAVRDDAPGKDDEII